MSLARVAAQGTAWLACGVCVCSWCEVCFPTCFQGTALLALHLVISTERTMFACEAETSGGQEQARVDPALAPLVQMYPSDPTCQDELATFDLFLTEHVQSLLEEQAGLPDTEIALQHVLSNVLILQQSAKGAADQISDQETSVKELKQELSTADTEESPSITEKLSVAEEHLKVLQEEAMKKQAAMEKSSQMFKSMLLARVKVLAKIENALQQGHVSGARSAEHTPHPSLVVLPMGHANDGRASAMQKSSGGLETSDGSPSVLQQSSQVSAGRVESSLHVSKFSESPRKNLKMIARGELIQQNAAALHLCPGKGCQRVFEGYVLDHDDAPRVLQSTGTGDVSAAGSDGTQKRKLGGQEQTRVFNILAMDCTAVIKITCWRSAALQAYELLSEHNDLTTRRIVRLELFRAIPVKQDKWNGRSLNSCCVLHTLDSQQSPIGAKSQDSLSLDCGSQISIVSSSTFVGMQGEAIGRLSPPLVTTNYQELSGEVPPFRVNLVGIIFAKPDDPDVTVKGELRQEFRVCDDFGNWIRCVAFAGRAESEAIQMMNKVAIFFGSARGALGSGNAGVWIFQDAYIVELGKVIVHTPAVKEVQLGKS